MGPGGRGGAWTQQVSNSQEPASTYTSGGPAITAPPSGSTEIDKINVIIISVLERHKYVIAHVIQTLLQRLHHGPLKVSVRRNSTVQQSPTLVDIANKKILSEIEIVGYQVLHEDRKVTTEDRSKHDGFVKSWLT